MPSTDAIPKDYDGVMGVPITFLDNIVPKKLKYSVAVIVMMIAVITLTIHLGAQKLMDKIFTSDCLFGIEKNFSGD